MRAQRGVEQDVAWLLERADQPGRVEQGALDRERVGGLGAKIAVPARVRREQWRAPAQIEDQVGLERGGVLPGLQAHPVARGHRHHLELLGLDHVGAEVAAAAEDGPGMDRERVAVRRQERARPGEEQGDVQALGEPARGLERHLAIAQDEAAALRAGGDRGRRRDLHRGLGQERGDLRRGLPGLVRPARALTNVHDGERRTSAADRHGEQRRLLGAGDQELLAGGGRRAQPVDLAAGELGMHLGRRGAERAAERGGVERHGALAVADEAPLGSDPHRAPLTRSPTSLDPDRRYRKCDRATVV